MGAASWFINIQYFWAFDGRYADYCAKVGRNNFRRTGKSLAGKGLGGTGSSLP
jgi:hypothetical protein